MYEKAAYSEIFPERVSRREMTFREGLHNLAPTIEKSQVASDHCGLWTCLNELEQCAVNFVHFTNFKYVDG